MKKRILIILVVILITISCNFPFLKNQNSSGMVSTQVSFALTATNKAPTQIIIPQQSSATPPLVPTGTAESTSTPQMQPTFTSTPADFAASLGTPTYSNSLANGTAFGIDASGYDDGNTRIVMSDGAMLMTSIPTSGWRGWRLTDRKMSNFYLEGTFIPQTCAGKDQYGLVFRAPDYATGEGYFFGVTCDGSYSLFMSDGNKYQPIINWAVSDKINKGSNQTNRLGVLAEGDSISLYINGQKVQEITDSTYDTATKVGAFISALSTPGFTVKLDQFNMWSR